MGGNESKLVFKKGIFRLSEDKVIPADDTYWASVRNPPQGPTLSLTTVLVLGATGIYRRCFQSLLTRRHTENQGYCITKPRNSSFGNNKPPFRSSTSPVFSRSRVCARTRCFELHKSLDQTSAIFIRGRASTRMGGHIFLGTKEEADKVGRYQCGRGRGLINW